MANPLIGGDNLSLLVDEAALPDGTSAGGGGDIASGTLAFTAGSSDVTAFAFGTDLSGLVGNTDQSATAELVWVRVDDTHIEARYGSASGSAAIAITLTPPPGGVAAGTSGAAMVTVQLLDNLQNWRADNINTLLNLGSIAVVGTDADGNSATDTLSVTERDDMPAVLPGTSTSIKVYEDALPGGNLDNNGDGTPDIAASAHTATIMNAGLQALVNPGADGPVVYRLRVATALTPVVDAAGNAVTSGGHAVYYQFADDTTSSVFGPATLGEKLFAFADVQDNGGTFDPNFDKVVFLLTNNHDGTFTFDLRGPVDQPAGSGDTGTVAIDLSPEFAPADTDDDKPHLNPGQVLAVVENDVPTAVPDTISSVENLSASDNVLANDQPGGDGSPRLISASVDPSLGSVTFTADGVITYTPATDYIGTASIAYSMADADGDVSSSTMDVTVIDASLVTPVTGGATASLLVDEAGLPDGTNAGSGTDTSSGTVSFTAGSASISNFAFSTDLSGLNGNTDTDPTSELVWVRLDDTHIEARYDSAGGATAITLTLTPPTGGIAAGASGDVTVTAHLLGNLENTHDNIATLLDLGSVGVVATDNYNTSASDTVNLSQRDDVPLVLPGTQASIEVYEDALPGGNLDNNGDGTPDISATAHTATFTDAALQSLIKPGADGPITYRLRLTTSGTGVVDANGQQVTSGGHNVIYQFVDSATESIFGPAAPGTVLFGFTDGEDNGGAFNAARDTVVFVLTNNGDGSFTFDLRGPIDHPSDSGDTATVAIDLSPEFAPADFDDDKPTLNPSQILAVIENDVPAAVVDSSSTLQNTPITLNVLTNDIAGADGGMKLVGASVAPTSGTLSFTPDGTITFTPGPTFTGSASIGYMIEDTDGDQSSSTWTVTVSLTAPMVTAVVNDTGVADAVTSNDTINGSGDPNAVVTITEGAIMLGTTTAAGNGAWSFTPSPMLADGPHTLTASETDGAGNTGSASVSFTVDTTSPAVTAVLTTDTGAANGLTSNDTINGSGDPNAVVTITEGANTLGTTTAAGNGVWSFTPSPILADGPHTLIASETDGAGNTGSASVSFTVDTTPPAVTAVLTTDTGAANGVTSNDTINGSGDPNAVVTITEGANTLGTTTAAGNGAWSFTPSPILADGPHTLTASETDGAGNAGAASVSFTVDTTPPALPVLGALTYTTTTSALTNYTLSGTAEPGSVVALSSNGTPVGKTTAGSNGSWSFPVTPSLTNNIMATLTTTATDGAGNVSSPLLVALIVGTSGANAGQTALTATGSYANIPDYILGLGGADALNGGNGNDWLDGGTGTDTMSGSLGNDTYVVDSASDVVVESPNGGNDTIQSSVTYTLPANVENLTLTGTANINGTGNAAGGNVLTGNTGNNVLSDNNGIAGDTMAGGLGNDTYVITNPGDVIVENPGGGIDTVQTSLSYVLGTNLENLTLTGTANLNGIGNAAGGNVLTGNSGNNTLSDNGATNGDTMAGGAGDDTYIVSNAGDVVTEAANAGTDTILTSLSAYTLVANVENLTYAGNGNFAGTGNNLANLIIGGPGNDTLSGGTGADTLVGGAGDDVYVVDNVGDVVTENPGGGKDTIQSSVTYTLPANVENLTLTGTANINGTGNTAGGNVLTGNSGNNTLTEGGPAALGDTMAGGTGNDTYVVSNPNDVIVENSNAGTDTVQSSINYTLGANVENLVLTGTANLNGTGNAAGGNKITGNAGDNVLSDGGTGLAAADTMVGGTGNDTYLVSKASDVITEAAGAGTDTVIASVISAYTLGSNVENLTFIGGSGFSGTGNGLDNVITGGSGNDTLNGGGGNDTLIGGAGADRLTGGAGNDDFIFNAKDAQNDLITDFTTNASQTDHIDFYGYTGDTLVKAGSTYNIVNSSNNVDGSFVLGNGHTLASGEYTIH